ncbi:MAG: M3 family oligoendopeptidase [Rhodospirillales bacterium]|nr:M3 family oligoendopeptidase [Rhodospirillales bacterium]
MKVAAVPQSQSDLPLWNLADLYATPDDPVIEKDLESASAASVDFAGKYKGRLADMTGEELAAAIAEFEKIGEILSRVMSYAQLLYAENFEDPEAGRFYQTMNERVTDVSTITLFFELEINRLDQGVLDEKLTSVALRRYGPWLRDVRALRDHQLSDELEELLHEKQVTGRAAWVRLFDETLARLRYRVDGKDLTSSEAFDLLSSKDGAVREKVAKSIGAVLGDNLRTFALITNTLAKDKEVEDRWRKYPRPVSARNLANLVEDEVVDALVSSVRDSYEGLSHRYYALKARWMGRDKLEYWDRNAPLPEDSDRRIPWNEAVDRVLSAYGRFSPDLRTVAEPFFEKPWIDAKPRAGKDSGAFAHSTVPSVHPYLLLNYHGKTRDVMTLAHELGHGVHQVLSAGQGYLQSNTPLTLAETASVFGEMLTFRALLDDETDPVRRRVMLAGKVEDMLNTVVRQVAFYEFERRVHDERRKGEISAENLGKIWLGVQTESLGPAFRFDQSYATYWSYIPHFVHSPFYVYAYAFGDCLVNALYAVFQEGHPGFQKKYMDMLRAGGTMRHKELLAPFGLDASDPAFWKKGLAVVEGFVEELDAAIE